jgi:hydroxymethylpyrimidine/phosphomethylpyrimidine kinase
MQEAARAIHAMGPKHVLVKGGHLPGELVVDLLYDGRDSSGARAGGSRRVPRDRLHPLLGHRRRPGKGLPVREAVATAQAYVTLGLQTAPAVGRGRRPLNHFPEGFTPPEERR